MERGLRAAGPYAPGLAARVAANMRALGVYSPQRCRAHFAHLAAHFANAVRMLDDSADRQPRRRATIDTQVELDPSVAVVAKGERRGGIIIAGPHTTSYVVSLARLSEVLPLTIYFRYPKRPQQRRVKERWCSAAGIEPMFEPATTGRRIARLADALAAGKTLYIPPDLPRKRDEGVAVRLRGREVWLPAGAGVLASRTKAPLYYLDAAMSAGRLRLRLLGPAPSAPTNDPRAAVAHYMQWLADQFGHFLADQAPLWYFWADKHWTRVLAGDPRYGRVLTAADAGGATPTEESSVGVA